MQVGYAVLALLVLSGLVVIAAALAFDVGVIQALVLLGIADLIIILGGWQLAKRAAEADKRSRG